MRKLLLPVLLACVVVLALLGVLSEVRGQVPVGPGSETVLQREFQGENQREILAPSEVDLSNITDEAVAPNEPQIGFIDSPTTACVQPDSTKDECFINWYYMSVSASPSYIITMTVDLNAIGPVARYHGFFQTSMYAPFNMNPQGYKVACGDPGAAGDPDWGAAYAWTIRARDSAGLKSANYGTVYCPAFVTPATSAAP